MHCFRQEMPRPHCTNDPCRVESKFLGSERWFSYLYQMHNCVQLFATPWTVAYQALLSMGFYRQEYWSGLPFPSPGDLPNPGIEPISPVASSLQADSLLLEPSGPLQNGYYSLLHGGCLPWNDSHYYSREWQRSLVREELRKHAFSLSRY